MDDDAIKNGMKTLTSQKLYRYHCESAKDSEVALLESEFAQECSGLIELDTFVRENEHTNRGAYDREKT